jgi:hypothetical protein
MLRHIGSPDHQRPTDAGLVKVRFRIVERQLGEFETLWARSTGDGYEILNIPLLVFGLSKADVVKAHARNPPLLEFGGVMRRGGHSTYRLMIDPRALDGQFSKHWARLADWGCTHEDATPRFRAVDVPPEADIYDVYDVLEQGMSAGIWLFEEGHVGHTLRA